MRIEKGRIEFDDPTCRQTTIKTPVRLKVPESWLSDLHIVDADGKKVSLMSIAAFLNDKTDLQSQKEWFTDLKDAIERDDKEIALQMVKAALLLLDRQMNVGQSRAD